MMDWSHAGRLGNTLTLNGQDLLEVLVRHNEYLRLRLCNTCNARVLELRIEHPDIRLVALAGQPAKKAWQHLTRRSASGPVSPFQATSPTPMPIYAMRPPLSCRRPGKVSRMY